jgi:pyruvate/2-oxoglutarate dehydrogenase complex dihydrolipoamide dehydrogenase (E3) component
MNKSFDVVVLGGGGAGVAAAENARRAGASVCLIEEGKLGGECPWNACVPTKALLQASKMYYHLLHDAGQFGIRSKSVTLDFAAMMKRKDAAVNTITGNGKSLEKFLKSIGVTIVKGRGEFVDKNTVRAGAQMVHGKAFVIATGSTEIIPEVDGIEKVGYLTYRDLVSLKALPESLAIIGGGPVGTEFATFFAQLGVKVALFHRSAHILSREDEEVALLAEERLRSFGVQIFTNTNPLGVKKERKGIRLTYQTGRSPRKSIVISKIAIAVGKIPNVHGLNIEEAGVKFKEGKVIIDKKLRTNAKHIFLAGDASNRLTFTHTAHREGSTAGWNAAHLMKDVLMSEVDLSVVPRATFLDPEVASVGMTAKEAVAEGYSIKVLKSAFRNLSRAAIEGKRNGILKIVVDKSSDRILGAHMMGERSGEIIHELALAMKAGIPMSLVSSMLHAYPTYSEIIALAEEI